MLVQMLNSLWLDTSGPYCSVGLRVGEQDFCVVEHLERTHNKHLLRILDELCTSAGLVPTMIDAIGLACGPGSFTGVRMGAACVQAIATAANCLVLPIKTNEALFASGTQNVDAVVAIKSRGNAFYLSQRSASSIRVDNELSDGIPQWLLEALSVDPNLELFGEKPAWWPVAATEVATMHSEPETMLDLVSAQYSAGQGLSPEAALPVYFSGDSPWVKTSDRIK